MNHDQCLLNVINFLNLAAVVCHALVHWNFTKGNILELKNLTLIPIVVQAVRKCLLKGRKRSGWGVTTLSDGGMFNVLEERGIQTPTGNTHHASNSNVQCHFL